MDSFFEYLKAFAVGGVLCIIGQLLIDYTKLTPLFFFFSSSFSDMKLTYSTG